MGRGGRLRNRHFGHHLLANSGYFGLRNMKTTESQDNPEAGTMLLREILSICRRFSQESDISAYAAIGALEMAKKTLIQMAEEHENGER